MLPPAALIHVPNPKELVRQSRLRRKRRIEVGLVAEERVTPLPLRPQPPAALVPPQPLTLRTVDKPWSNFDLKRMTDTIAYERTRFTYTHAPNPRRPHGDLERHRLPRENALSTPKRNLFSSERLRRLSKRLSLVTKPADPIEIVYKPPEQHVADNSMALLWRAPERLLYFCKICNTTIPANPHEHMPCTQLRYMVREQLPAFGAPVPACERIKRPAPGTEHFGELCWIACTVEEDGERLVESRAGCRHAENPDFVPDDVPDPELAKAPWPKRGRKGSRKAKRRVRFEDEEAATGAQMGRAKRLKHGNCASEALHDLTQAQRISKLRLLVKPRRAPP